jgi:hypothetical protein
MFCSFVSVSVPKLYATEDMPTHCQCTLTVPRDCIRMITWRIRFYRPAEVLSSRALALDCYDTSESHSMRHLIRAASSISGSRRKLVISRDLGPDAMAFLRAQEDLEV